MDNRTIELWYDMFLAKQISNIGSEVHRAIRWKNKGDIEKQRNFCNKAIKFIELSMSDEKNIHRKQEFGYAIEELEDYFLGDNVFQTTDEILIRYYDSFLSLV